MLWVECFASRTSCGSTFRTLKFERTLRPGSGLSVLLQRLDDGLLKEVGVEASGSRFSLEDQRPVSAHGIESVGMPGIGLIDGVLHVVDKGDEIVQAQVRDTGLGNRISLEKSERLFHEGGSFSQNGSFAVESVGFSDVDEEERHFFFPCLTNLIQPTG